MRFISFPQIIWPSRLSHTLPLNCFNCFFWFIYALEKGKWNENKIKNILFRCKRESDTKKNSTLKQKEMNLTNMNFEQKLNGGFFFFAVVQIHFAFQFKFKFPRDHSVSILALIRWMCLIRFGFWKSWPCLLPRSHFSSRRCDYSNIQLLEALRIAISSICSCVKWWINQLFIWKMERNCVILVAATAIRLADFSWGD